jgi:hypothetical protein
MAQGRAQAILADLTDAASRNELEQLSGIVTGEMIRLIANDTRAAQALGTAIGSDETAVDNIFNGIGNGTMNNLSAAVAADPNIHAGIDRGIAANLRPGSLISTAIDAAVRAGAGAPVAAAAAAVDINDFKLVQFTDRRDKNGPVAKEMTVEKLFKRDPLLYDSQTGQYKDLAAMLGNFDENTMRLEYMEPGSRDVPKLRYAMSAYIESPAGTVGPLQTGVKSDSNAKQNADTLDRENLAQFSRFGTWSKEDNPWRTPDNFIDFRRLLLKTGYEVTGRNNAVDTHNDVYVYYFNKVNALTMNDATLEVPFADSNFMLPTGWKVYARYPDGALMYKSPAGVMQAEFPRGTFFKSSTTKPISRFEAAAQAAVAAQKGRIDGIGLSLDENQSMYQFAAYLGIMQEIKNSKQIRGGSHNITHRRRMSVKRNKKMTRSSSSKGSRRGRGKGRARAASMLKSAKQRYYKTGGMGLGLGQSTPQPLQTESLLISQASPV